MRKLILSQDITEISELYPKKWNYEEINEGMRDESVMIHAE
jgi:hypothetical protein